MDNSTQIQEGRIAAMENYVDFSGERKSNLTGTSQLALLSSSDKKKYLIYGVAGLIVVYLVYKKYK